jgi:hypothetical protein
LVWAIERNVRQSVRSGIVGIYDYGKRVSIAVIMRLSENSRQDPGELRPSAGAEVWNNVLSLNFKDALN